MPTRHCSLPTEAGTWVAVGEGPGSVAAVDSAVDVVEGRAVGTMGSGMGVCVGGGVGVNFAVFVGENDLVADGGAVVGALVDCVRQPHSIRATPISTAAPPRYRKILSRRFIGSFLSVENTTL